MAEPWIVAKDVLQILFWVSTAGGGLIAAFRAIREMKENREQRIRELGWRQAQAGQELIGSLYRDPLSYHAMLMIDWVNRVFEREDRSYTINQSNLLEALRVDNLVFTESEMFIRDCFDTLFLRLEQIKTAIEINLTQLKYVYDVRYYLVRMALDWDVFNNYAIYGGYQNISKLFKGFGVEPREKQNYMRAKLQPANGLRLISARI